MANIIRRLFGSKDDADAPERLPSPDDLVFLVDAESEMEAAIFRDMLAGVGINALIKNRDVLTAQSGVMAAPWTQQLWVLRKDLRRARIALDISDEGE
jgi:hypothetical protein